MIHSIIITGTIIIRLLINVPPNHCNNVSLKGHCVIHSIILIINRFYIYIFYKPRVPLFKNAGNNFRGNNSIPNCHIKPFFFLLPTIPAKLLVLLLLMTMNACHSLLPHYKFLPVLLLGKTQLKDRGQRSPVDLAQ